MRAARTLAGAVLTGALLLTGAAGAVADDSPSPSPSTDDGPPNTAGTDFRSATVLDQGEEGTADASTGDYLYWVFPADAGQDVTVRATVAFPTSAPRHGPSTWQVDVYDGLRRRQACRYGVQTAAARSDAASVRLTCHLRTVRAWAEPWSNDPLRGAYYVRLTELAVPSVDLGLPVRASVRADSSNAGASQAVDGSVTPLVPRYGPDVSPSDGWAGTWWSARWLWTVVGGVLAALAAIGGYALTRGSGRPRRVPPGVPGEGRY